MPRSAKTFDEDSWRTLLMGFVHTHAPALGLTPLWTIRIVFRDTLPEKANFQCEWNNPYRQATISASKKFLLSDEATVDKVEHTMIHELNHLMLMPVYEVIEKTISPTSPLGVQFWDALEEVSDRFANAWFEVTR